MNTYKLTIEIEIEEHNIGRAGGAGEETLAEVKQVLDSLTPTSAAAPDGHVTAVEKVPDGEGGDSDA